MEDDGYKTMEIWTWDSMEKKWFSFREDLEVAELDTFIREIFTDHCDIPLVKITKWASMQMGNKASGRSMVFHSNGIYEDEDDYGEYFETEVRQVAIVNIDFPSKKFREVRRMLQNLVKSGGFTPKKGR